MRTRLAIVVLWLVAGSWAFNLASLLFGPSSILLPLVAGGMSGLLAVVRWAPIWQVRMAKADTTPVVVTSTQGPLRSNF